MLRLRLAGQQKRRMTIKPNSLLHTMPNPLTEIPPDERHIVIIGACVILFVFGGLSYFRYKIYKNLAIQTAKVFSKKEYEKNYEKYVWKTPEKWMKVAGIYTVVGFALLIAWYFFRHLSLLLFGSAGVICGVVGSSYASMSQEMLTIYLESQKKYGRTIAQIAMVSIMVGYVLFMFMPTSVFESIDILTIFGYLALTLVISGTLYHFYTKERLMKAQKRK